MFKKPDVLKYPNYSRLYFSNLSSEFGSFVTEVILMLHVFSLGHDNKAYLGIMRAVFLIFIVLGGLLGGPIGERFNRKKVLLICEIARIPLIAALFFTNDIFTIIAIDGLIAFFTGIFRPARQAMVTDIVPPDDMRNANAMFGTTNSLIHLAGPLVGATAYAALKGINEVLIFDLFTYAIGIYLLGKIHYIIPESGKSKEKKFDMLSDLKDGLKYIFKRNDLIAVYLNCIIAGFSIGILIPLIIPFTLEILGKTEREYGYLMALFGLGGMLGSWMTSRFSLTISTGKLITYSIAIEPILFAWWIRTMNFYVSLGIFFLWGVVVFLRVTSQLNYVSETVPTEYLTRSHSLLELSFMVPNISGGIIIGLFGNSASVFEILNFGSIVFIICIYPRLFLKNTRELFTRKTVQVFRDSNSHDSAGD